MRNRRIELIDKIEARTNVIAPILFIGVITIYFFVFVLYENRVGPVVLVETNDEDSEVSLEENIEMPFETIETPEEEVNEPEPVREVEKVVETPVAVPNAIPKPPVVVEPEPEPVLPLVVKKETLESEQLRVHNEVRAKHGLEPLVWSGLLAASSDAWAGILQSRGCEIEHDPNNNKYGENLYWYWYSMANPVGRVAEYADSAIAWAAEEMYYNYEKNTCKAGEMCGHYTQMVWEDTREVGCAIRICRDSDGQRDVHVCRYNPPGNYVGERPY